MVKGKVLKTFGFSVDGLSIRYYEPGETVEIFDAIAAGLIAEGYMRADASSAAAAEHHAAHDGLHVKHIGRGKYAVMRGDERLTNDPLDKDEAESALAEMLDANQ